MNKGDFELSIDTMLVYEKLITIGEGETIIYEDISAIIHRDIMECRHILDSARRKALNQDRIVFDCVRNVGLKRLDDKLIACIGDGVIPKLRRAIHRGRKALHCVKDFDSLSNVEKVKHNASLAVLGAVAVFTKPKKVARLEASIKDSPRLLSLPETFELFK